MSIAANLARVTARIAEAAKASGRKSEQVRLVAVSKTHPAEAVKQALAAGQLIFGENYVQESQDKIPAVGLGASWHFIGHLQSNKAKVAAELFDVIQSVDRIKLARALDRHAGSLGRRLGVLLQVNVGGEAQKSGCAPEQAFALAQEAAELPNLELMGLMTMPPFFNDPEAARPCFAELRRLAATLAPDLPPGAMAHLSMGMSGDYQAAIAEGATLVRVGTAIFGERDYS
ncbi:MAG: YggS family pyridoxal phosphate-dependent enzyme [Desulfarculaceae bacterium]|nr:YggS family pyridoxal phosphate-dependent enzyme [Desulfarculaceae bacterium]MCF8072272.1 YggS family pyridoxal phosphate-dependent enzyme [Desulfarculaceae bacterium]MCF8100193.1 YggS family pyridoxal phosphate-dependent enzyme [Desulfarculaceae bacterium]MCF8117863.1 YggS family pyridoxal phosphate-dependent enzyme [Desulfarculaceae bacterium]